MLIDSELFHFQKRTGWGGDMNFFWGYIPPQFNYVDSPPPGTYLRILNSILHLEPPCATHYILNYLIPPPITNNFQTLQYMMSHLYEFILAIKSTNSNLLYTLVSGLPIS